MNLQNITDRYRAYRYFNIRERGFARLLVRDKFPADEKHKANESLLGPPQIKEEDYYDLQRNEFFQNSLDYDLGPSDHSEIEKNHPNNAELVIPSIETDQDILEFSPPRTEKNHPNNSELVMPSVETDQETLESTPKILP